MQQLRILTSFPNSKKKHLGYSKSFWIMKERNIHIESVSHIVELQNQNTVKKRVNLLPVQHVTLCKMAAVTFLSFQTN